VGQDNRIHGAGRRAGYTVDAKPGLLEQTVEHAPGECAMCAAPLERKVDGQRIPVHDAATSFSILQWPKSIRVNL
jgi:hypothetical protein